jgi:hypothetical protein
MSNKLVMHYKGPKEATTSYNRYVVNGKLFRIVASDVGKRIQNSDVCVCRLLRAKRTTAS